LALNCPFTVDCDRDHVETMASNYDCDHYLVF